MRAAIFLFICLFCSALQAQHVFEPDTNGIMRDTAFVALLKARHYDIVHRFQYLANHQFLKVAMVERNGKKGFIDQTGLEFIPCEYSQFDYRGYGLRNGHWERVDLYHMFISPAHYNNIAPLGHHYYIVRNKRSAYIIDYTNSRVKGMSFSEIDFYSHQLQVIRVRKGHHLFGMINTNAQMLIPPSYHGVIRIGPTNYLVSKNGRYGVVDTTGKFIIPLKYDDINFDHRHSFLIAKNKGRFGLLNQNGDTLAPLIYEMLSPDFYGTVLFRQNGLNGLMDTLGKVLIPPGFHSINTYSNRSFAAVAKADTFYYKRKRKYYLSLRNFKWGLYHIDSSKCLPLIYDQIEAIHQDNFLARKNNRYAYINSKGKVIADTFYKGIQYMNEMVGLMPDTSLSGNKRLPVYISRRHIISDSSEQYGMHRHDGSKVLPYRFSNIRLYFGNVLTTDFKGLQRLYDTAGKVILPDQYRSIEAAIYSNPDSNYNMRYQPVMYLIANDTAGHYGLFSKNGRSMIPCRYSHIQLLDTRYILAAEDSLFGILDTNGNVLLPLHYKSISKSGKYYIVKKDFRGILDHNLKMLLPCSYEIVYPLNTQFFRLIRGGSSALYNSSNGAMSAFEYQSFTPDYDLIVTGNSIHGPQYLNENCSLFLPYGSTILNVYPNVIVFRNQAGKLGLCDRYGNILYHALAEKIQMKRTAYYQSQNCFYFQIEGKWGVLDLKGNQILAPVYDEIRPAYFYKTKMYASDTWLVRIGKRWYQCDAYGKLNRIRRLVKLKYD